MKTSNQFPMNSYVISLTLDSLESSRLVSPQRVYKQRVGGIPSFCAVLRCHEAACVTRVTHFCYSSEIFCRFYL